MSSMALCWIYWHSTYGFRSVSGISSECRCFGPLDAEDVLRAKTPHEPQLKVCTQVWLLDEGTSKAGYSEVGYRLRIAKLHN
jgi:hypothetical protein